jgi:eukaryotic-like serine/threonine-protein kinase
VLQEQMVLPVGAMIQHPDGERYTVKSLLGKGGFGAVYLVRDRHIKERLFALKEIIDPNKRDRERFIFEAEVLKRLNHRALPHVYKVFEYEKLKRVYMLMDYIEGQNLDILLGEQPERRFSLPLVLAVMKPIVDALIYLHSQNPPIVHRDIKPSNIIVSTRGGEAVLVDFGLAKEYIEDNTTTIIRHGSPGYAAPEQYGSGTNPRTDIYGLGATLYTLLTGTIPIDAIARVTGSKGIDPLVPIHLVVPSVSWANAMAIEKAMSISSDDRFNSVEDFWQELNSHTPKQQLVTPLLKSLAPAKHQVVPEQQLKPLTTSPPALHNHAQPAKSRKSAFLFIFLTVILTIAIGTALVSFALQHNNTSSTEQRVTPTLAHSTPQSTATSAASHPSTVTPGASAYPDIVASYAGRVLDLMNGEKTDMFLTQIHQNGGSISGYFKGLGMVGPFTGTVTPMGHLRFSVTVQGGASTLSFEGDIKIGGDIVGSFKVLNQHGQFTGESGLWNISSHQ